MERDLDLDILIAQKIKQMIIFSLAQYKYNTGHEYYMTSDPDKVGVPLPSYSIDVGAAWSLIDSIDCESFSIGKEKELYICHAIKDKRIVIKRNKVVSLAICMAVLDLFNLEYERIR